MKSSGFSRFASSSLFLLSLLAISSGRAQTPTNLTLAVTFWYPTNSETFTAPANIGVHAQVVDSNLVQTMQYFSGATSIGIVSNTAVVVLTNWNTDSPFYMLWSNVPAGSYTLTAVATDAAHLTATSPPVNITVLAPPPVRPAVYIYSPTNNSRFVAPTNLALYARSVETTGTVQTVQFFAGSTSLGVVSNISQGVFTNISSEPLFPLTWSNAPAGSYALTAVATDAHGITATSSVVNISVVTNLPPPPNVRFAIGFYYPTNGQTFTAPASVGVHAWVTDSNLVLTVQYFAGATSIGIVTNSGGVLLTNTTAGNPFFLSWSNVPAGSYALTAVAADSGGLRATSAPVNITVLSPPPPPSVPFAIGFYYPTNSQTFTAPASVGVHAWVTDSNVVLTVQYLAGATSIGIVTNTGGVLLTNTTAGNPFFLSWSNVPAGSYTLTAVATDAAHLTATSPPVNITVLSPPPPPSVPFAIGFYYPTNGQTFTAPASVGVHAWVTDSNVVLTVQYFAGATSIGIVTNTGGVLLTNTTAGNPFFLSWSNVPAGSYALTAVAADSGGLRATSAPVNITVLSPPPPPNVPFAIGFYYPTNDQTFTAPASVGVHAWVTDSNVVLTVQYFAGATSIGIVTNSGGVLLTNTTAGNPFFLSWSNVPAGSYTLTAVATDAAHLTATSPPVNITVLSPLPPLSVPFAIGFYYRTDCQTFTAPANVGVHVWVTDSNLVLTVQDFAGATSIGIVTNTGGVLLTNTTSSNPFFLLWSNVPAGSYTLTAVATDAAHLTATSPPVNITVLMPPPHTNQPPVVRITSPPNAAVFRAPVNIPIYAYAHDPDGYVTSVEFLANTNILGFGSPIASATNPPPTSYYTNLFSLVWSNALPGSYALTAIATDNSNAVAVSLPVNITILPPSPPPLSNPPPTVIISAIDPIAIEGTNCWVWSSLTNAVPAWTNWPGGTTVPVTNCGPKNATFSVYHSGNTNSPLTVSYAIGGTASNGVDYVALPGVVTIPAGQRLAMISVVPIDDGPPGLNRTVILTPTPSTNVPPAYLVGSPASAEALILESPTPAPATAALSDRTFHLNAAGPNGAWFYVEYSTDMLNWTPICTNQVVNGSIDFLDPDASTARARFYRAVPEANPPQ